MAVKELSVWLDYDHGVEQGRSRESAVDFMKSDHDGDAVFARNFIERFKVLSSEVDRVLTQPGVTRWTRPCLRRV